jgi:hypothetical protein
LWDTKVYPHSFKENLGSVLHCDALLAGNQNRHIGKVINNHKTQSFPCLVEGMPDMYSIEMDSEGLPGVGRGVYMPCFVMSSLEIAQEVKDEYAC